MDGLPVEERPTAEGEGREAGVTVARRFVGGVADDGVLEMSGFRFLPVVTANEDFTLRPAAVTAPIKEGKTGVTPSEISRIISAITSNPTRRGGADEGADDIVTEGGESIGGGGKEKGRIGRHSTSFGGATSSEILQKAWWWGGVEHRN